MELLIPKLNLISSYQFLLIFLEGANDEQSSQYNQSAWCHSPLKYGGNVFHKRLFLWDKVFPVNLWGDCSTWED